VQSAPGVGQDAAGNRHTQDLPSRSSEAQLREATVAKSKPKLKNEPRRAARRPSPDQRVYGRGVAAVRQRERRVLELLQPAKPRRSARIGARVRPLAKARLTSLAQVTGKSEGEILELAIGRLLPSDIVGPSWVRRVLFWRR
jgi:hypothetical protein